MNRFECCFEWITNGSWIRGFSWIYFWRASHLRITMEKHRTPRHTRTSVLNCKSASVTLSLFVQHPLAFSYRISTLTIRIKTENQGTYACPKSCGKHRHFHYQEIINFASLPWNSYRFCLRNIWRRSWNFDRLVFSEIRTKVRIWIFAPFLITTQICCVFIS